MLHPADIAKRRHRLAQAVGIGLAEFGSGDGEVHRLLLKQWHAQRFAQHIFQLVLRIWWGRRGVFDLFLPITPPQIRVHHIALNGAGADNRNLNSEVI